MIMESQARLCHNPQTITNLINEVREIKEIMLIQSQLEAYQTKITDLSINVTEQSKALTRKDYEISMLKAEVDLLTQGIRNNEYVVDWLDNCDESKAVKSKNRFYRYKNCYRIINFFKSLV